MVYSKDCLSGKDRTTRLPLNDLQLQFNFPSIQSMILSWMLKILRGECNHPTKLLLSHSSFVSFCAYSKEPVFAGGKSLFSIWIYFFKFDNFCIRVTINFSIILGSDPLVLLTLHQIDFRILRPWIRLRKFYWNLILPKSRLVQLSYHCFKVSNIFDRYKSKYQPIFAKPFRDKNS